MTEADIENAIKAAVALVIPFGYSRIWPNVEPAVSVVKPYVVSNIVRFTRADNSLKGGGRIVSRGQLVCTVVTELGKATRDATEAAQAIADAFPKGRLIQIAGGHIKFTNTSDIQEGFRQDQDWRTIVVAPYEASSN